jgi:VWFA-related protein
LKYLPRLSLYTLLLIVLFPTSILSQVPESDSKTISLRITAVDEHGRPISGLKQGQFSVFEKKKELPITSFESSDEPASIVFLFDVSGSVSVSDKEQIVQSAFRFTKTSNQLNDYAVIAFHSRVKLLCDWGCADTEFNKALEVVTRTKEGLTAFYDACEFALTKLKSSKYKKHVIIVFSDGQDNASRTTFNKLKNVILASSVALYAIRKVADDEGSSLNIEGMGVLDELAEVSGGKAYHLRNRKELPEIAELVAGQLSQQYTISFKIERSGQDNKRHSIKIRFTQPKDDSGKKLPKVYLQYREIYDDR